jgi:hypothetical protein
MDPMGVPEHDRAGPGALIVEDQHAPASGLAHGRGNQYLHPGQAPYR